MFFLLKYRSVVEYIFVYNQIMIKLQASGLI